MKIFTSIAALVFWGFCSSGSVSVNDNNPNIWIGYLPDTFVYAPYGDEPHEFGFRPYGHEQLGIGPSYFAVDKKGNAYVVDNVKRHIKKFDKDGKYVGNIGTNMPTGNLMAIGTNDHIFIRTGQIIHEYLQSGQLYKSYSIPDDIWLGSNYMQGFKFDEAGNLYDGDRRYVYQLGRIIDEKFTMLSPEEIRASKRRGYPGIRKNTRIITKQEDKCSATIQILEGDNNIVKEFPMQTYDEFSGVYYIGQDKDGYIYVQVGIITGGWTAHYEVRKYAEDGSRVMLLGLPSCFYIEVQKILEVDSDGNIYQFFPRQGGVEIRKWKRKVRRGNRYSDS